MSSFNAHVSLRLRPTRFGFLVAPNDTKILERVFALNTCLWGGKYNPIIPVFGNRPKWWDRDGLRSETSTQIANGYLDYFEPDVIVETRAGQAAKFGFNDERVARLQDLIPPNDRLVSGYSEVGGLLVYELYQQLYEREFQFSKREPEKMVRIFAGEPALGAMAACIFGAFPRQGTLHQFEKQFDEVFTPEVLKFDASTAAAIITNNWKNPLHITHEGLEVRYANLREPRLFVFDGTHPGDLIDYWNLRAGVAPVIPIPVQFASDLADFAKTFVRKNYRPLPNNSHGVMIRPTVMFSRSIDTQRALSIFEEHFRVDVEGANTLQNWYPPIWRRSSEIMVSPTRPTIHATKSDHYLAIGSDDGSLAFESLEPEFVRGYGGKWRWANVFQIDDWSYANHFATTYPDDYRNARRPAFGGALGSTLTTSEGYVRLADHSPERHFLRLETNASAIGQWLNMRGIKSTPSDAGRATQQIIQTLGGLGGVSAVANADIVRLLNGISRSPRAASMEHNQFRNRVEAAVAGNIWNTEAARLLIERDAVELGLEVRCDKCRSWTWYALADLELSLKCGLCLKQYAFPALAPANKDRSRWAYRLIGPFAQPDFAQGGYSAALAIRFFSHVLELGSRSGVTWTAGQELAFPDGKIIEADFLLWYRRREIYGHRSGTELVLGEAKSFGRECFTTDDVERMKRLAIAFPGAVLVFATMKLASELTPDEVSRIAGLARWGRQYDRQRRRSRAPVILLTGTELFADHTIRSAWKKVGGRHAELIEPAYVRPENLGVLADLTQQLYLRLEPYHAASIRRWERRRVALSLTADAKA